MKHVFDMVEKISEKGNELLQTLSTFRTMFPKDFFLTVLHLLPDNKFHRCPF